MKSCLSFSYLRNFTSEREKNKANTLQSRAVVKTKRPKDLKTKRLKDQKTKNDAIDKKQ